MLAASTFHSKYSANTLDWWKEAVAQNQLQLVTKKEKKRADLLFLDFWFWNHRPNAFFTQERRKTVHNRDYHDNRAESNGIWQKWNCHTFMDVR